jgi:hypothetical protein
MHRKNVIINFWSDEIDSKPRIFLSLLMIKFFQVLLLKITRFIEGHIFIKIVKK